MANSPIDYTGREDEEPQIWTARGKRKSAGDSVIHFPCGHWHKIGAPGTVGCLRYEAELNAAPFGAAGPRSIFVASDGFLYSLQGWLASPTLKRINLDTLTVVASKVYTAVELSGEIGSTTVNCYDLQEYNGYLYASVEGRPTNITWLVRININTLEIVDRIYLGDTCVGTDGNNYHCKAANMNDPITRPITGSMWHFVWRLLPVGYSYNVDPWTDVGYTRKAGTYAPIFTSAYIYVTTWSAYYTTISKFDWTGKLIAVCINQRIQIANIAINPSGTRLAVLYGKTGYTSDPSYVDIIDTSNMSLLVNAKYLATWNPGVDLQTSSVIYHQNGHIYCCWMEDNYIPGRSGRVGVSKIDWNGNIVKTYESGFTDFIRGTLVFASEFLFWWQGGLGDPVVGGIVKLDLDLNVICIEPFHFVSVSQGFQETAIAQLAIASHTGRRNFIWLGRAGHYTKWYYY